MNDENKPNVLTTTVICILFTLWIMMAVKLFLIG